MNALNDIGPSTSNIVQKYYAKEQVESIKKEHKGWRC